MTGAGAGGSLAPALWTLLGAAAGFAIGFSLRRRGKPQTPPQSFDLTHAFDLLRKAHASRAGWAIGLAAGEIASGEGEAPSRGMAFVQVASVDGRVHVAREAEGSYVAVGDFPYGAALLLEDTGATDATIEAAVADLRRFIEAMREADVQVAAGPGLMVARQLALGVGGAQTLEGVARAGVELAEHLTDRAAAVVMRSGREQEAAQVIAVSPGADKRLVGRWLHADAPVSRALQGAVPIVTKGDEDVFGPGMPERRRHEREGYVYPLMDGRTVVGALVLIGPTAYGSIPIDRLASLVGELGPRLAAARAVHEAEQRAVLDPLTGLRNRREFQRVLESYTLQKTPPEATLVYVDLDRFKRLNDTLGHAAGDAALKHVARVLEAAVRDGDLVARIGGEEFAVWLPRAGQREGLEVAERIRETIASSQWQWSGTRHPLTTSCGVATYPQPIADVLNLPAAADAALYRAKQAGRNRVEKAAPGH